MIDLRHHKKIEDWSQVIYFKGNMLREVWIIKMLMYQESFNSEIRERNRMNNFRIKDLMRIYSLWNHLGLNNRQHWAITISSNNSKYSNFKVWTLKDKS